jgi:phosphate transport system protein
MTPGTKSQVRNFKIIKPDFENHTTLINFLLTMSQTVQTQVEKAIEALLTRNEGLAGAVALYEPRVNALEVVIDEHAVKTIVGRSLPAEDVRLIVATIKINNDLERMGDLAVNIAQRVISLSMQENRIELPQELIEMASPVRQMVIKSHNAMANHDISLAEEVLRSDDEVDDYRNRVYEKIMQAMSNQPRMAQANFQLLLASRYLERIADHSTNIAEDVIFWIRGVDVRHNRLRTHHDDLETPHDYSE